MAKFIKHINLDGFDMLDVSTTTVDINYVNVPKLEPPKFKHLKELSCRYCKGEIDSKTLECKYCGRKYYYG